MMQTDVKSVYITASGANAYAGPARVKGIYVNSSGAGTVELTNGTSTGTSLLKFDYPASATANPIYILLPGEGIQFPTSVYVKTLTGATSATIFYG